MTSREETQGRSRLDLWQLTLTEWVSEGACPVTEKNADDKGYPMRLWTSAIAREETGSASGLSNGNVCRVASAPFMTLSSQTDGSLAVEVSDDER